MTEKESGELGLKHGSECIKRTNNPKKWGYKNILGLSVTFLIVFSVFMGLQNLQSSINSAGGLGLASLATLYAAFILAGFVSPAIVKVLGTKYSLLLGFNCHLVYTLTNYYPSWYTLIPSSILLGFASAPLWAAASTHITKVSVDIAPALRKDTALVISKSTGIFFFFFQLSQLPGNLLSSLILFPYTNENQLANMSETWNGTAERNTTSIVPTELCNYHLELRPNISIETATIGRTYLYALVSVYTGLVVLGIIILLIFVDRLPTDNKRVSTKKTFHLFIKKPFFELLQVIKDWRMLMITPMATFSGMEMAFAFGSFTEIYISECFGTYQVGFTLIALGLSSATVSIMYGKVVKCIPRFLVVLLGAAINVILLVFLFVWERVPSYEVIFAFAIGWGAADAVCHNVSCSLTGILFADRSETAYSIVRIWQAFGFTAGFATAEILSLEARLCLLLATVSFATLCSLVVEFKTQTKAQLLPCIGHLAMSDGEPENASPPHNEKNLPLNASFATYSGKSSLSCTHTTTTSPKSSTFPDPLNVTTLAEGDQCYCTDYKPEGIHSIYRSPSYLAALTDNSPHVL